MSYFKNNYRCEKCNGSKFYIEFLAKEIKIICVNCGKEFSEKTEIREKKSKDKRYDNTVVMISAKVDEIEDKQSVLIGRVDELEQRFEKIENKN
ncbi:MAG: hypothetical protein ACRC6T_03270 [Sarcina sp.]